MRSLTWDASAALPGEPVRSVHTEPQLLQEHLHLPCEQQSTAVRHTPVTGDCLSKQEAAPNLLTATTAHNTVNKVKQDFCYNLKTPHRIVCSFSFF